MKRIFLAAALLAGIAGALVATGHLPLPDKLAGLLRADAEAGLSAPASTALPPAVTVITPTRQMISETALFTGTLVARREILLAPEVEGLRIVELFAEEGDSVVKGQPLARLDSQVIISRLAENEAALARSDAAIAQAQSNITQAEARNEEAQKALERAKPLLASRALSESVFEQREAAARTNAAQLIASRDGLKLAKSERKQIEAQRRELEWRLSKTTLVAPSAGLISRRSANIGSLASGALTSQPLFHLVEDGEIEVDADVPEVEIGKIRIGQAATLLLPGDIRAKGVVRLVSPEIDRTTRLGSMRITVAPDVALRVGGFARGTITTAVADALTVPLTALMFTANGARVKVVEGGHVKVRIVETGIQADDLVEIRSGVSDSDELVAKAGSFLRDGDAVKPVGPTAGRITEAR